MNSIFKALSFRSKKNGSAPLKRGDESDNIPRNFMDNPMSGSGSDSEPRIDRSTSSARAEELRYQIAPEPTTLFSEPPSITIAKLVASAPDDSSVGRIRTASRAWSESASEEDKSSSKKQGKKGRKGEGGGSGGDDQIKQVVNLKKLLPSQSWSENSSKSGLLGKFRRNKSLPLSSDDQAEDNKASDDKPGNGSKEKKSPSKKEMLLQRRSEGSNHHQLANEVTTKKTMNDRNSLEIPSSKSLLDDDDDDEDGLEDTGDVTSYETYDDNDDMDVGDPNDGSDTTDWEEYEEDDQDSEDFQAARTRGRTRSVYSSEDTEEMSSDSDSDNGSGSGGNRSRSGSDSDGGGGRQSATGRVGYDTGHGVVTAHRTRVDMMKSMGYGHKPERMNSDRLNPGEKSALEDGLKQAAIRSNIVKLRGSFEINNHLTKYIHERSHQVFSSLERPDVLVTSSSINSSISAKQEQEEEEGSPPPTYSTNLNYTPQYKYIGVGGKIDHSDDDDSEDEEESKVRASSVSSTSRWSQSGRSRSMSGSSHGGGGLGGSSHGGFSSRQRRSSKFLPVNIAKVQRARVVLVGNKGVGISTLVQGIYQINNVFDHHHHHVQGYNSKHNGNVSYFGLNNTYKFNITPHHHHHLHDTLASPSGLFHSTHPITLFGATSTYPYKVQIWDLGRILHPQISLLEESNIDGENSEMKEDFTEGKTDEAAINDSGILPLDTFSTGNTVSFAAKLGKDGKANPTENDKLRRPTGGGSMDDEIVDSDETSKEKTNQSESNTTTDTVEISEEVDSDSLVLNINSADHEEEEDEDSIENGKKTKKTKKKKEKIPLVSKSLSPTRMKSPNANKDKESTSDLIENAATRSPSRKGGSSGNHPSSPSASPLHQRSTPPPIASPESSPQTSPPQALSPPQASSLLRAPTDGVPSSEGLLPPIINKPSSISSESSKQPFKTRSMKYFDDKANEDTRCCVIDSYLRGASAIGVCYDISDASTLESLEAWLRRIGDAGVDLTKVPILLICNKIDLTDPPSSNQSSGRGGGSGSDGSASLVSSNHGMDGSNHTQNQSSPDVSASESESEANFGDERSLYGRRFDSGSQGGGMNGMRDSESSRGVAVGCKGKRGDHDRTSLSLRESIGSAFGKKSISSSSGSSGGVGGVSSKMGRNADGMTDSQRKLKKMSAKKRREFERQEAAAAAARRRRRLEAFPQVRLARELGEKYGLMGFHNGHGRVELVSGTTGEGLEDALFHVAEMVQKKRQSSHKGFGANFVQPLLNIPSSVSSNSLSSAMQATGSSGSSSDMNNGNAVQQHEVGDDRNKPKLKTMSKLMVWTNRKPKI